MLYEHITAFELLSCFIICNLNFSTSWSWTIIITHVTVMRKGKTACNVAWNGLFAQTFNVKTMISQVDFCKKKKFQNKNLQSDDVKRWSKLSVAFIGLMAVTLKLQQTDVKQN